MRIRFWGVRGSHPAPGPSTSQVGGNTSCVAVSVGPQLLVFDAGTGMIELGRQLRGLATPRTVHVFLSHFHHDHVEGLRFFAPVYGRDWTCVIHGPGDGIAGLQSRLESTMAPHLFPVEFGELPARIELHALAARDSVDLPGPPPLSVQARFSEAHPRMGVFLYRVECAGSSFVYATDVEAPKGGAADVVDIARGADVLVLDAQYTDAEYFEGDPPRVGWGHSTVRMAAEIAAQAQVGRLLLFHHDPSHDDRCVQDLEAFARSIFPATSVAREGLEIQLPAR